jgi:hypothetical protein
MTKGAMRFKILANVDIFIALDAFHPYEYQLQAW